MIRIFPSNKLRAAILSVLRRAHGSAIAYASAQAGNVAIMFALAAVPLVGAAGLALDSGRAYLVEHRLSAALDSATLAAVQVNFLDRAETDARAFFDANFPNGYMNAIIEDFEFNPSLSDETIEISVTAGMPTTLMRVLGKDSIHITRSATAQRLTRGLELALVMDVTGSMASNGRMGDMKTAAEELVTILSAEDPAMRNTWISLVPYAATVNIGHEHAGWLEDPAAVDPTTNEYKSTYGHAGWKGCVMVRRENSSDNSRKDESDLSPSANNGNAKFAPFYYAIARDNLYDVDDPSTIRHDQSFGNKNSGPNTACAPAITPLTNERSLLIDRIRTMQITYRGGTISSLGMVWGWRSISPEWRGMWHGLDDIWEGPDGIKSMPLDYDEPLMSKAIVLLTDGEAGFHDWSDMWTDFHTTVKDDAKGPNGSDFTSYGRLNDAVPEADRHNVRGWFDAKLLRVCTAVKDAGIDIYTITFGGSVNEATRNVFEECASAPGQHFHAPTGGDLQSAFRTVGRSLSHTRLVK